MIRSWRKLIRRVRRIVMLNLTELPRVGISLRLRTLGRLFIARRVTLEGHKVTLIYRELHSENWIKVTNEKAIIFCGGVTRTFYI